MHDDCEPADAHRESGMQTKIDGLPPAPARSTPCNRRDQEPAEQRRAPCVIGVKTTNVDLG